MRDRLRIHVHDIDRESEAHCGRRCRLAGANELRRIHCIDPVALDDLDKITRTLHARGRQRWVATAPARSLRMSHHDHSRRGQITERTILRDRWLGTRAERNAQYECKRYD